MTASELEHQRRLFKHNNPDLYYLIYQTVAAQVCGDLSSILSNKGEHGAANIVGGERSKYRKKYLDKAAPLGEQQ